MINKEQEMNRSTNQTNTPVTSRPIVTQEWSLHAELTFSHDGLSSNAPARQPSSDSGVHTSCSWGSPTVAPMSSGSSSTRQVLHPCYGFQRGNILFTTIPPSRPSQQQSAAQQLPSHFQSSASSGPPSANCSTAPCRSPQPYNRRCKSTCSIILSEVHEPPDTSQSNAYTTVPPSRGTSCSPIPRCYHTLTHRCGDPVCYHASCVTDNVFGKVTRHTMPASCSVPDIDETCEVCGGGRSPTAMRRAARANTFTTHFCTRVPERAHSFGAADKQTMEYMKTSKDAAIQTSDLPNNTDDANINESKIRKAVNTLLVPGQELLESSSGKKKPGKKLSRSPARLRGKSPLMQSRRNSVSESRASSPEIVNRKPRTVHIDVYCTGSEDADADASNTSDTPEEGESWSSPQTVFESDKLRVVHTRAGKNQLPQALQTQGYSKNQKRDISYRSASFKCSPSERIQQYLRGFDSDDGLSSHYPSKQSSYTTLQDTESSLPSDVQTASRDPSSSTISSSSCALFEEYDSIAATSWKDTVTEIDSVAMSNLSLALSDSFEYADAMDRLRIREKEKAWGCSADEDGSKQSKTWQSPSTERKHLLQQKKFKEYVERHHGSEGFPLWKSNATEESEEEDDDETGDAWIFSSGGGDGDGGSVGMNSEKYNTIKRESVRKASGDLLSHFSEKFPFEQVNMECSPLFAGDSGSLSDSGPPTKHRFVRRSVIGPFGVKPPSPPPSKLGSVVTSPFTAVGRGTDQLHKAQKFGTIIGAFRKPGHHIGPARNPDCTCEHCREYYENTGRRGRARSVGEMSCVDKLEWKS